MPPRILRELIHATVKLLSIIFKPTMIKGLDDSKKTNTTSFFKKAKEELGTYRSVGLSSVKKKNHRTNLSLSYVQINTKQEIGLETTSRNLPRANHL